MKKLWHRVLCLLDFHLWVVPSYQSKITWSEWRCLRCNSSYLPKEDLFIQRDKQMSSIWDKVPMIEQIKKDFNLTDAQCNFLAQHKISLSNGYIGMLRAYYENRTVWQTSAFAPFLWDRTNIKESMDLNKISLGKQLHSFLDALMLLSKEEMARFLQNNIGLYH